MSKKTKKSGLRLHYFRQPQHSRELQHEKNLKYFQHALAQEENSLYTRGVQ